MKSSIEQIKYSWQPPPAPLKLFIIIILISSIFLRFVGLDQKLYWHDEVLVPWRISGYTLTEVQQEIAQGEIISIKDLAKYQHINSEKNWIDIIKCIAQDDVPHSPFYFLLVRLWTEFFGDSKEAIRSFSVCLSFLSLIAVYWLCVELFASSLIGWIAVTLLAVSPFHFIYAQEARTYSLWILTILSSSALLLRSIRLPTKLNWGLYALTLATGFYTFILMGLVSLGHSIYVLATEGFKLTKKVKDYGIALGITFCLYAPWLWVIITNQKKAANLTKWTTIKMAFSDIIKSWIGELSRLFFDFNLGQIGGMNLIIIIPVVLITILLVGYSLYFIYRQTSPKIWLFILTLITVTTLPLMLPDLLLGGQRSTASRYITPAYLGIEIAVAYFISNYLSHRQKLQRHLGQIIVTILVTGGLLSCMILSQVKCHPSKGISCNNIAIADIINQVDQPLIISNFSNLNPGNLFSLSYLLNDQVKLQLVVKSKIPKVPENYPNIFLYTPTQNLLNGVEKQQYQTKLLVPGQQLNLLKITPL